MQLNRQIHHFDYQLYFITKIQQPSLQIQFISQLLLLSLIHSSINHSMPYLHRQTQPTFDKCQKILRMFQEISADSIQVGRMSNTNYASKELSSSKKESPSNPYFISHNNAQKSVNKHNAMHTSTTKYNQSTSKSNLKSISSSFCTATPYQSISTKTFHPPAHHREPQSLIKRQKSNSSFVSCYNRQSRLDKIMKLRVPKPQIGTTTGVRSNKKMLLNSSLSSLNSSRSSLNKENINLTNYRNKESRLEKIMNIKVEKPKVNSTLINYEPRKLQRSTSKSITKKPNSNDLHSFIQLKQVKKKQHKSQQIQQKEERLWRTFERQRQQQLKEKKKSQEQYYKEQRRKQEKFEKLVQKQLRKIQNNRQISLRKERAFSEYTYPAY